MILQAADSGEFKRRFKIVRTDYCPDRVIDNPDLYEIISADEETGEFCLQIGPESETRSFGPGGIKIVARGRG